MAKHRRRVVTPYWRLIARSWLGTIICTLAVVTFACGLSGFIWQYAAATESQSGDGIDQSVGRDWSIPVFKTVQLFLLNSGAEDDTGHPSNWLLVVARMSAATLFLVVSWAVIRTVLDEARKLPRLLARRNHVVICGLGQIGLQILDDLHRLGRSSDVVIVENDAANSWLSYARSLGASVVIGDSTKADTLIEARVPYAAEVFVVNGDDGVNLEVTAELGILLSEKTGREHPLQLYVHIVDTNLATTLRPYCTILHDTPLMQVHVFNVPRAAAVRLVTQRLWPHAPRQQAEVSHFVILGFGPMGQALAVQLAQLAHFPNRKRSRFTIADPDIRRQSRSFLKRFSRFTCWSGDRLGVEKFGAESDEWDWTPDSPPDGLGEHHEHAIEYVCNAEFVDLSAGCNDVMLARRLFDAFSANTVKPAIFVCGQQDRENFDTAVRLREQLSNLGRPEIPIFVWLPRQPALAEALARDGRLIPFGECRTAASYEEITRPMREAIGRKIHEDYERQAIARGDRASMDPWENIRDDFRESNRVAADHLILKLAALGHRLEQGSNSRAAPKDFDSIDPSQLQLLAEMEHYRWVAERLLAGWRFTPEGKTNEETQHNKQRKLNHNLVPWSKLGTDRKKDFDQVKTVLRECQRDGFSVADLPSQESSTA